jgi:hypothetical protein
LQLHPGKNISVKSWNFMKYVMKPFSWKNIPSKFHEISLNISWNFMKFHQVEFHEISWNFINLSFMKFGFDRADTCDTDTEDTCLNRLPFLSLSAPNTTKRLSIAVKLDWEWIADSKISDHPTNLTSANVLLSRLGYCTSTCMHFSLELTTVFIEFTVCKQGTRPLTTELHYYSKTWKISSWGHCSGPNQKLFLCSFIGLIILT